MKNFKIKNISKKIFIVVVFLYFAYTLLAQQKMLNLYQADENKYAQQIEQEQEIKTELAATKDNVNSSDYIEQVAREKLGMYLPNERVYLDMGK